jgi:hypothetical protein
LHRKSRRCYAWSYPKDDGEEKFYAVLELPPVTSAMTAIQAAILADFRNGD